MINKITEKITMRIILKFHLNNSDQDIYSYGMFMFLSFAIFGVIAFVFGIIFDCVIESFFFYIFFQLLRKYCGGYHADTSGRCEFMTTIIIIICIASIKAVEYLKSENILFLISLLFFAIVYILSPIDTKENPLSKEEKKEFQKISRIIIWVILSIISVTFIAKFDLLFVPCCVSIILEGALLIAGKIKNTKRKINIE